MASTGKIGRDAKLEDLQKQLNEMNIRKFGEVKISKIDFRNEMGLLDSGATHAMRGMREGDGPKDMETMAGVQRKELLLFMEVEGEEEPEDTLKVLMTVVSIMSIILYKLVELVCQRAVMPRIRAMRSGRVPGLHEDEEEEEVEMEETSSTIRRTVGRNGEGTSGSASSTGGEPTSMERRIYRRWREQAIGGHAQAETQADAEAKGGRKGGERQVRDRDSSWSRNRRLSCYEEKEICLRCRCCIGPTMEKGATPSWIATGCGTPRGFTRCFHAQGAAPRTSGGW